jgi:hypothetical protein
VQINNMFYFLIVALVLYFALLIGYKAVILLAIGVIVWRLYTTLSASWRRWKARRQDRKR